MGWLVALLCSSPFPKLNTGAGSSPTSCWGVKYQPLYTIHPAQSSTERDKEAKG